jgi:excisionase family DNA binding protein
MNNVSLSGPMLLTVTEASNELGVSRSTTQHLINTGRLTTVELDTGKAMKPTRRIRRSDLVAFVENLAVQP